MGKQSAHHQKRTLAKASELTPDEVEQADLEAFGEVLALYRRRAKLRRRDVAKKTGINEDRYYQLEYGTCDKGITKIEAMKIAVLYGIPYKTLEDKILGIDLLN